MPLVKQPERGLVPTEHQLGKRPVRVLRDGLGGGVHPFLSRGPLPDGCILALPFRQSVLARPLPLMLCFDSNLRTSEGHPVPHKKKPNEQAQPEADLVAEELAKAEAAEKETA